MTAPTLDHPAFLLRVLRATADPNVAHALSWAPTDDGGVAFQIDPDDMGGIALTPDNLPAFEQALADAHAATGGDLTFAPMLFAARFLDGFTEPQTWPSDRRLWPLFEQARLARAAAQEAS